MKSITATLIFLYLIYLSSQAASVEEEEFYLHGFPHPKEAKWGAVLRALSAVKFGLQTLKREESNIKQAITLEALGFVPANSKSCNFTDIESNFADLVIVTIDFATDAAGSLETIFDLVNVCANTSFPKSISCFLKLIKTCQPDIDTIKEDFQEFQTQASSLTNTIIQEISKCYH